VSLRDDVLMRMISQLVDALMKAVGLRKKKDLPAAEQAIGDGLKHLGLSLELVRRMPSSTLAGVVTDPVRRALVAASLCELAIVARSKGDLDEADQLDDTASDLFAGIDPHELPDEVKDVLPPDMRG
jgi:hypothetical protein